MATPAQRTNTWILDEWYDQAVAGTTGGYNGENQLWTWGENDTGGAGSNNTTNYSSPIQISGTTWANATGSFRHSAGIKNDGTLWSWGYNYYGELGLNGPTPSQRSSPTQIPGTTWSDVSTGNEFMLAKKTDGTLWSWGQNDRGQLGTNQGPAQLGGASSPIQVGTDTDWNKMTGGTYRSFAIKTDGTLWAFGRNDYGYLGQNNTTQYSSPVQIPGTWDEVGAGWYHDMALKTDGTLWAMGYNGVGELGLNNTTKYSSPTQVGTDTTWSNITSAAYASAAVKTDGTLWTWGRNNYGALGHNQGPPGASVISYSSPKQVGTNTTWSSVAMSEYGAGYQTYGLKTDGTLWAWGYGDLGGLGQGTLLHQSSPVQIPGTGWTALKCESRGGRMAMKQF
tara:strand:- start:54 stop:1235 length:1182 start_codon:yes stop_codon:yes gene_type:complete